VFLFSPTVRIINRNTYTSGKKAAFYCGKANPIAEFVSPNEIRMLENAEMDAIRISIARDSDDRQVPGVFAWHVGDSGGSKIMKDGTARGTRQGQSGGYRVLKATHGDTAPN
jgi:hypothetical protein